VAELVDAPDLKSVVPKGTCLFDSDRGHHITAGALLMPIKKAHASEPAQPWPRDAAYLAAAFAIGAAAMLLYDFFHADLMFPFWHDAASYVTAARNLRLGNGLVFPTLAGDNPDLQTISLWPPGYPFLIYVFSFLCGTPTAAALLLSRLSLALVPIAAFWLVRPYCTPGRALVLSLLFWTPLGLMPSAYYAGSDAPFFLLALLSTAALLRGMDARDPRLLALAGMIAGASLLIRNAGLSLLAAQAAVLTIAGLTQWREIRLQFRLAASWGLAAALPVCGLLAWNKVKFGTLSPYTLPPSTLGLAENAGAAMDAYVFDSFPHSAGRLFAPRAALVSTLLFAALISLLFIWACLRYRQNKPLSRFTQLAVIYTGLGTIMVVMARTRYQWGEPISTRHIAQYDSFLISATLLWLAPFRPGSARMLGVAVGCIVLGIIGWRGWYFASRYEKLIAVPEQRSLQFVQTVENLQNLYLYYERLPEVRALSRNISPQCYIATNLYPLMNSTFGHDAHDMNETRFVARDRTYLQALNGRARSRPVLIVLGQTPLVRDTASTWRQELKDALPAFRLVSFDKASLIVLESTDGGCLGPGKQAQTAL
jgi:hypothetical protein